MEKIRKFYLPIVHFLSLGLLISLLITSPWRQGDVRSLLNESDNQYEYKIGKITNIWLSDMKFRIQYEGQSVAGSAPAFQMKTSSSGVRNATERQNRALIVYTLLAMYLGSGYLLFKKN